MIIFPLIFTCMQKPVLAAAVEEDFSGKCGLEKGELIRDDSLQYEISLISVLVTEEDTAV